MRRRTGHRRRNQGNSPGASQDVLNRDRIFSDGAFLGSQWGLPGREEAEAVEVARESELVVMVLGLSARLDGEEMKVKADGDDCLGGSRLKHRRYGR